MLPGIGLTFLRPIPPPLRPLWIGTLPSANQYSPLCPLRTSFQAVFATFTLPRNDLWLIFASLYNVVCIQVFYGSKLGISQFLRLV